MTMLRIICIKISKLIPSYFPCTHLILACSYIQTKQKRCITKQHKVLHIPRIISKTGKLLTEDVRYERDFSPIFVSSHKLSLLIACQPQLHPAVKETNVRSHYHYLISYQNFCLIVLQKTLQYYQYWKPGRSLREACLMVFTLRNCKSLKSRVLR